VHVSTECASPAYLDERFPVHVDVANEDELEVNVSLVVFLQPGEEGSCTSTLSPAALSSL